MYLYLICNPMFNSFILFLPPWQTLDTTGGVDAFGNPQLDIVPLEPVVSGIRSALGAFREGLHELCKGSLANIFRAGENLSNTACLTIHNA